MTHQSMQATRNEGARIHIPLMVLYPKLGLGAEEREVPQKVEVALTVSYISPPGACDSDNIEDTLCYHTLRDSFLALIQNREFKLIEHLTKTLLDSTEDVLTKRNLIPANIEISLHKVHVPLGDVPSGATFSMYRSIGT